MACNDEGRQVAPMTGRKDFNFLRKFSQFRQERGRQNFFSPKNERTRQTRFDDALRAKSERMSQKMEDLFLASFHFFTIFTTIVRCGARHVCVDPISVSFSCLFVLTLRLVPWRLTHAGRRGIGDSGRGDRQQGGVCTSTVPHQQSAGESLHIADLASLER